MKLKAEATRIEYVVVIPQDKFLKLIKKDNWNADKTNESFDLSLNNLGCDKVEYNGHFGPNIYFRLGTEDTDRLPEVVKTIETYLNTL